MPRKARLTLPSGTKIPNHIVIIPDGNRRWARARGLHTLQGHKQGFERAVEVAKASRNFGVHTVTLWGFSTENWDRTKEEINYLMKLYVRLVDKYLEEAEREEVRIIHLGRKDRLPNFLVKKLEQAEKETLHNTKYVGNIAIDYGGQDDIIRATKAIIKDGVNEEDISKETIEKYLDTKNQPYPYVDLIIRTSGEQRTSGILLWQSQYAEIYWETDHFPDFTPEKLREAILDYSRRRRRFGGNDQEGHLKFKPELSAKLELNWWRLSKIPEDKTFSQYAYQHLIEQWGLSKSLAKEAAKLMVEALAEGKKSKWEKATIKMKKFYKLIKGEVRLAFEPSLAASLEVKLLQKINGGSKVISQAEVEDVSQKLISEVYRISDFQARKAAHLRSLATVERNLAELGQGEEHWDKAKEYLELYYKALKDRVA